MKLSQWMRIVLITGSVSTLVACHHSNPGNMQADDANAAYNGQAQTYGAGEETTFGDKAASHKKVQKKPQAKKVAEHVYHFDFDKYFVHEQDRPAIVANANYLLNHPSSKVLLEGHTDPRGSREYNIGLGERRAKAVADILTAKGVRADQIRIVSYGAQKLAMLGRTEQDYELDRRAVIVYLQR